MGSMSDDAAEDGLGSTARHVPDGPPRRWLPRDELVARLGRSQADAGLRQELADLTDDGPEPNPG
jgi:hypothetical protein